MPETFGRVVVHHARGLHISIAYGGADEVEPPFLHIIAHCVRYGGLRGKLPERLPRIVYGASAHELPNIFVESPEFFFDGKERLCVLHRGVYFQLVSDYAWVLE